MLDLGTGRGKCKRCAYAAARHEREQPTDSRALNVLGCVQVTFHGLHGASWTSRSPDRDTDPDNNTKRTCSEGRNDT